MRIRQYVCGLLIALSSLCVSHAQIGNLLSGFQIQVVKNITDFGAVCDGVTNDAVAFASFGDWAIANQGTLQVVLNLPAGATCLFNPNSAQSFWLYGPDANITAVSDNGSGKARLTVNTTTRFTSGWTVNITGLTGTPLGNGSQVITIVDGTHFDLLSVAFVAVGTQNNSKVWSQQGVKNLLLKGNGGTIKNTLTQPIQMGTRGIVQDSRHSARTVSASAGATTITLNNPALAALFVPNTYAIMTGFDLQGIWQAPFGFPPNLHFFEYVYITNVNAGAGVITISSPLVNSYLSTWPNYNSGSFFEVDAGGPATLYFLDPAWNTTIRYQNLTFDQVNSQSVSIGYSLAWDTVAFTGANCAVPSQNYIWQAISVGQSTCNIEVDKLIKQVVYTNSTINHLKFQSSSTDLLTMSGSTLLTDMSGSAKTNNISNSSFVTFQPGAFAYGASTGALTCTNCTLTTVAEGGFLEQGSSGAVGINNMMTMSGGAISYPNGTNVTGAADNGSGKYRLTVVSTAGFATGQQINITSVGMSGTSCGGNPSFCINGGNRAVTVVDGTHFDVLAVSFDGAYTSGGIIGNYAPRWAIPGSYVYWSGSLGSEGVFKITDVTQTLSGCAGSGCTTIQTSLAGGFPTLPLSAGKLFLKTLATPAITCTGCTGSTLALDLAAAPAALPMWSYAVRTYNGSIGSAAQPTFTVWGNPGTISLNVTNAYSGAGALTFNLSQFNNWSVVNSGGTTSSYGPIVNAKTAGNRSITFSGVTGCQAGDGGGACPGNLSVPDAVTSWFGGASNSGPKYSADVSGSCPGAGCPSVTVTIQTNQGIVYP